MTDSATELTDPEPTRAERLAEGIPDDANRIQFDVVVDRLRRRFVAVVDGSDIITEHIEWYVDPEDGEWTRSISSTGPYRIEDGLTGGNRVEHAEQPLSEYAADRFLTCLDARLGGRIAHVEDVFDDIGVTVHD